MVRDDHLALLEELVRHADALTQQTAGILPQIQDQSLQLALLLQLVERFSDLMIGRLLEARNVDIPYPGTDHEVHVNAVTGNLVTNHIEVDRLLGAFTQNRDLDRRALGSLEQLSYVGRAHVVGRLAIDSDNHVARPDPSAVRRRTRKRSDHDDLVIARTNL